MDQPLLQFTSTHTIRVESLDRVKGLIDEHNRRLFRLGKRSNVEIAPASVKTLRTFQAQRFACDDEVSGWRYIPPGSADAKHLHWWAEVAISGQAAMVSGWEFVATVSYTDEKIGFLVSKTTANIKGLDLDALKQRGGDCDHCQAKRTRKATYVLRSLDSQVKLVGSSCLKDFTGHMAPAAFAAYADMLTFLMESLEAAEGEDEEGASHGGSRSSDSTAMSLGEFLGYVRRAIRTTGEWISRSKARDAGEPYRATVSVAECNIEQIESDRKMMFQHEAQLAVVRSQILDVERGLPLVDRPEVSVLLVEGLAKMKQREKDLAESINLCQLDIESLLPAEIDRTSAEADLEIVERHLVAKTDLDDFETNLQVAVNQGYAFGRNRGLVAAICSVADRIRRDIARENARKQEISEWFSTEGKRETFALRCVYTQPIEGVYGTSYLHIFIDPQGRKAKWFASSERLAPGTYEIVGTVKRHEEYQGKKVTQLTRCKVVKQLSLEGVR